MRITGGTYRGRELISPQSKNTHPMGSRERLALFNSLQLHLKGAQILDAYAGTGAVGLEALSRGAKEAYFIEKDYRAILALQQNISMLGVKNQTTVIKTAVENFEFDAKFDLIFADPPYDKVNLAAIKHLVSFLKPGGLLVLSHPATLEPTKIATEINLQLSSTKSYAAANISVFNS